METPDYLAGILAKSDGETLFAHTQQVLARFADQARLRGDIAAWIGSPRLWHRLYWACLLHDFGKAATGFQRMLITQGAERWGFRHEIGSLAFVPWFFPDPSDDDYRWIVAAIVSHHKDAAIINGDYKQGSQAVRLIVSQLREASLVLQLQSYREVGILR